MKRETMLARLRARRDAWDMLVIGGGATGVGIAVDAASRGYSVALLEQADFGKGTSSRSTKLIHGGVRYLQQGNIPLVMEALRERGVLRQNAPHLVADLGFVVPNYAWWEAPFYGVGMKVYDLLAGRYGFGPSRLLSEAATLAEIPTLRTDGLLGGVRYHDGQFDDARLLISLARTAVNHGALVVNYLQVDGFLRDADGYVAGVTARDLEGGARLDVPARVVVNAAGAFCDVLRRLDDADARPMVSASQGVHIVLDRSFLPGRSAIMVPHTADGRVMFAIPWHDHVLVGTTDTPVSEAALEPRALDHEIALILDTAANYLGRAPRRSDIRSVFAGIRPLVSNPHADGDDTAALSREHSISVSPNGLLTIAGGKWTTYRKMAQDVVDHAAMLARLDERSCITRTLRVHGYTDAPNTDAALALYGSDAEGIISLMDEIPELAARLHPDLPYRAAEVVWAARYEMARSVEDVLARRTRALFLNAGAAMAMAPAVARLLASELARDNGWVQAQIETFCTLARGYLPGRAGDDANLVSSG